MEHGNLIAPDQNHWLILFSSAGWTHWNSSVWQSSSEMVHQLVQQCVSLRTLTGFQPEFHFGGIPPVCLVSQCQTSLFVLVQWVLAQASQLVMSGNGQCDLEEFEFELALPPNATNLLALHVVSLCSREYTSSSSTSKKRRTNNTHGHNMMTMTWQQNRRKILQWATTSVGLCNENRNTCFGLVLHVDNNPHIVFYYRTIFSLFFLWSLTIAPNNRNNRFTVSNKH